MIRAFNRAFFRWFVLVAALTAGVIPLFAQTPAPAPAGPPRVLEINIEEIIQPVVAEFVGEVFDRARQENYQLILITLNTPGGTDGAMRDIIQRIITSPVPVVVYVWPTGRRAASAGFYILLAADVAAMAPGTDTGAASPVFAFGGAPVQVDETMRKKVVNEASAYLRTITEKRGRNVALAEKAVTEARAFTEKEALEGNLIDLVAPSPEELLRMLDGREIRRFDGSRLKLSLAGAERVGSEMNRRQRLLSRIAQPDIVFVLLLIALLGLYVEFSNPGLIFPGVIGGVALILVLVASQVLPINALGVLLILAAVGFFILEAKFASHGLLGLTGVACLIAGALFLIRSPLTGLSVNPWLALATALPFAIVIIVLMRGILKSLKWQQSLGVSDIVGARGVATTDIDAVGGMVRVHGELWKATSSAPISQGTGVRVLEMRGLTLIVEPADAGAGEPSGPPSA